KSPLIIACVFLTNKYTLPLIILLMNSDFKIVIFNALTFKIVTMKKTLLLMLSLLMALTSLAQISLVKNLNPSSNNGVFGNLVVYNNKVYFSGNSSGNSTNYELFESDGTDAGTVLVRDISPGTNTGGNPNDFYVWNNTNELYFSASGGVSAVNIELWKTDGTANGTVKVSEFDPSGSGTPQKMTGYNNKLYMSARESSIGFELGTSSGTLASSVILKDIRPGSLSSVPDEFFEYNGFLYFSANNGLPGNELWRTNGTSNGTVLFKDIHTNASGNPRGFTLFNNMFYFAAEDGPNGRELWRSNGTPNGTVMVQDINFGGPDSDPENFIVYNNRLYFTATTSIFGRELYYIGTTGTVTLANDIQSLALDSNPSDPYVYNNKLYFTAGDGVNGRELWVTDGTIPGTVMLKDINPSGSSNPRNFQEYNGKLYFNANGRLWVTDGTSAGTVQITGSPSDPEFLVVANNLLFFRGNGGSGIGRELYIYEDPALSLDDLEPLEALKLFPNPTGSTFSINNTIRPDIIKVYDITGKLVKEFKTQLNQYDISDLYPGVYMVNIQVGDRFNTLSIIKN
ncbi:MAG: ELWxxDGT repeat protein, partial [Bacteroidota bacterium]